VSRPDRRAAAAIIPTIGRAAIALVLLVLLSAILLREFIVSNENDIELNYFDE
jgi:hypothetical protein